jgi:hypothetical protein
MALLVRPNAAMLAFRWTPIGRARHLYRSTACFGGSGGTREGQERAVSASRLARSSSQSALDSSLAPAPPGLKPRRLISHFHSQNAVGKCGVRETACAHGPRPARH